MHYFSKIIAHKIKAINKIEYEYITSESRQSSKAILTTGTRIASKSHQTWGTRRTSKAWEPGRKTLQTRKSWITNTTRETVETRSSRQTLQTLSSIYSYALGNM